MRRAQADTPYGVYDKVEFDEVIRYPEGDSFAPLLWCAWMRSAESLHILEQLVDNIPAGDYAVKTKPLITSAGRSVSSSSVEASRG